MGPQMFQNRGRMGHWGRASSPCCLDLAARPPASSWAQLTEGPSDVTLIRARGDHGSRWSIRIDLVCEPPGPSDPGPVLGSSHPLVPGAGHSLFWASGVSSVKRSSHS